MITLKTLDDVNRLSDCLHRLDEVEARLTILAQQISCDLGGSNPVVLGVMRGALPVLGFMLPRFDFLLELDYVHATRYQKNLTTGELLWLHEPHVDLRNRQVLLVDDILDRGVTLKAIADKCYQLGAADVKIVVLCEKKIANFTPVISADYVGFNVPDAYIFGYGMDCEGAWRNASGIFALNTG